MNIGEAARQSGLPPKTIRYYEEIKLVHAAARAANGYRDYSDADIHKLRFVRQARSLGFTVEECAALLSLYENKQRKSSDVKKLVATHLDDIDSRIAELQRMRGALQHLAAHCHGDHRPDCPIIDGLAAGHS